MLDINYFRKDRGGDPDAVRLSQKSRGGSVEIVDEIIELDAQCGSLLYEIEQINASINKLQKDIRAMIKSGEPFDLLVTQKAELTTKVKLVQDIHVNCKKLLITKLSTVGNILHESVIVSDNEADNGIVRKYGITTPVFNFKLKSHYEIMLALDMVDTKRGTAIAGHRGYFLKDYGVLLNQALINYSLDFLRSRNYTLLQPPYYMFGNILAETVQLSDYDENQYQMADNKNSTDKYLIATSEQPISAYHRNETIYENDLSIKYCGISTCFRKEAGAHGKDIQGIFRVHQFEKVEQFCLTTPETSWQMFEEMIRVSEEFYQSLELNYQIVNIVSGELNNAAAKKYDLEAWFPESQKYRELVSCSNCTDYQSANMNIRLCRNNINNRKEYVHCLNSTLCATERTMCCILENYQTEHGVVVPPVLRKYLNIDFLPYKK